MANGLVMVYKRLEDTSFTWPAVTDGLMTLNRAQVEALFAGLDWRKVKPVEARRPTAAEGLAGQFNVRRGILWP